MICVWNNVRVCCVWLVCSADLVLAIRPGGGSHHTNDANRWLMMMEEEEEAVGCRSRDLSRRVASRLYAPERLHAQISNLLIYKYRYSVLLAIVCMWLVTHSRAAIMY